jgi:hypothetical protein
MAAAPTDTPKGKPNCGVVVVAILCQIDHQTAFEKVRKASGKKGNWKGRTFPKDREPVLDEYGVKLDTETHPRCTLMQFVTKLSKPGEVYIVTTNNHVQTVLNGKVYDQQHQEGARCPSYLGSKARIEHVDRVLSGPLFDLIRRTRP